MDEKQLNMLDEMVEFAGTGVLATVDGQGNPQMRHMTAAIEKSRPGALFTVTYRESSKVAQIENHNRVQWLFFMSGRTARANGTAIIVDNPAVTAGVMELLGSRLERFWKQNIDPGEIVVLETVIHNVEIA